MTKWRCAVCVRSFALSPERLDVKMPLENGSFDRNAVILLDTYVCIMHINTRDGWGGE